eukprot:5941728-Pyramimonas_sp.AAC.1
MALYASAGTTLVLRHYTESNGDRYHQRTWTAQEYCNANAIIVRDEPAPSSEAAVTVVVTTGGLDEESYFNDLRNQQNEVIPATVPLWLILNDQRGVVVRQLSKLPYGRQGSLGDPTAMVLTDQQNVHVTDGDTGIQHFRECASESSSAMELISSCMSRIQSIASDSLHPFYRYDGLAHKVYCYSPKDKVRALLPMLSGVMVTNEEELYFLIRLCQESVVNGKKEREKKFADAIFHASDEINTLMELPSMIYHQ